MPSCEINVSFLLCQNYWRAVLSFCWAAGAAGQLWILSSRDERKYQASYNWGICTWDFAAAALRVTCFVLAGAKIISASSTVVKVFTESLQMGRDGQVSQNQPNPKPWAVLTHWTHLLPSTHQTSEQAVAEGLCSEQGAPSTPWVSDGFTEYPELDLWMLFCPIIKKSYKTSKRAVSTVLQTWTVIPCVFTPNHLQQVGDTPAPPAYPMHNWPTRLGYQLWSQTHSIL